MQNCGVHELDLYGICLSKLCCKILLLLNVAESDMVVFYVEAVERAVLSTMFI